MATRLHTLGDDVDLTALVESLQQSTDKAKAGDLSNLEAMLIGQATALQTIFTSLAKRAAYQTQLNHYQTFLGLALKAQAQSRATISALVDLKYPRQATFVKQANIAHGPQQVNNGAAAGADPEKYAQARTHAENTRAQQNELLEDTRHGGTQFDTRATQSAVRSHQTWKPWNQSTGPQSANGKAAAARNAWTGGHAVTLRQLVKELNQALKGQRELL